MSYHIESFKYKIDDEEKELDVIGDFMIRDSEYIVADDGYDNQYIFYVNEEENIYLIEDEELSEYILNKWKDERYGSKKDYNDFESYDENESLEELHIIEEDEDL